jgi:hypothetical protein
MTMQDEDQIKEICQGKDGKDDMKKRGHFCPPNHDEPIFLFLIRGRITF